jgi:hypothetical protein
MAKTAARPKKADTDPRRKEAEAAWPTFLSAIRQAHCEGTERILTMPVRPGRLALVRFCSQI